MKTQLKIKPYARLITMLGDQLIKNEKIALIELIKNSYDADSTYVNIEFKNFGKNFEVREDSQIIINDNGTGMSSDTIKKHWLNPATPNKVQIKRTSELTPKKRIIQGEKGIGRFSIYKLGKTISLISKMRNENLESVLLSDFSKYNEDFLENNNDGSEENPLFLEDLIFDFETRKPKLFITTRHIKVGNKFILRSSHGTQITISNIKGSWSIDKIVDVYNDVIKLQSIFEKLNSKDVKNDFRVLITKDGKNINVADDYVEDLLDLLENKPIIKIENGKYDEENSMIEFDITSPNSNKRQKLKIPTTNSSFTGTTIFRKNFTKKIENTTINVLEHRKTMCGPFNFSFYIFDLEKLSNIEAKYYLDKRDRDIVKSHRVYLYRDGIRVYPYGDPKDDWLGIDTYRGLLSAGSSFSNDQIVGCLNISNKLNANLKDKTNREGIIQIDTAYEDFTGIIVSILSFIKITYYDSYKSKIAIAKEREKIHKDEFSKELSNLKDTISDNSKALKIAKTLESIHKIEKNYLEKRAQTTENLAGVGLAVETATHDIMALMEKAILNIEGIQKDILIGDSERLDINNLEKEINSLKGILTFIQSQLSDVQILFNSSKQRKKKIRVIEILTKVIQIYKRVLSNNKITIDYHQIGSPLIFESTDAVMLQTFINLIDNSVYWLSLWDEKERRIEIILDGDKMELIFADSGPGINENDKRFIFEPFYSGKGEDGRGLGLYIAQQLLNRYDYLIELIDNKKEKILAGANFRILQNSGED